MKAVAGRLIGTRDVRWASNDTVLPLQLAALRIGMRTILLVPLCSSAALVVTRRGDVEMGALAPILVALAVGAGLGTLLPFDRLFRMGWGTPVVFACSVVNLAVIAIGVWATGGSSSSLMILYALTTVFFAVAFPPRLQVVLLTLTAASYSLALGGSRWDPISVAILAVLAFLANVLVRELKRQMVAHRQARLESERRWALLAVVSAAARQMSAVEPVVVLRAVVDAVVALGFPSTRMYVQEDGDYPAVLPAHAGDGPSVGIDSLDLEAIQRVLASGQPAVVGGAGAALLEPLQGVGSSSLLIIPIPVGDRVEAILVVGVDEPPGPSPQEVEVLQMLATQAAVALENVRRFEDQRRSMDQAAELDRMKTDFLSNISHELRTPLTVIHGIGRTLEDGWSVLTDEDRRDLLTRLNANAASLDSIIAELLDFGRLEAGQLEIEPVDVDLRDLLNGVVNRLASLFRDHEVRVEVEDGLAASADPVLVERVVENLLTNAAKYSPPGSRIHVSAIGKGRETVVAVEDDGPGIPPDELSHIGERFFRGGLSTTRTIRGTGLGLALASEILDLHGTYLEVESEVGVGSRFSFRLPRCRGAVDEDLIRRETIAPIPASDLSVRPLIVSEVGLPDRFETVLAAAQMGLEWPVSALFREFHPRVLRYLRAHLPHRAEELASETWNDIASELPAFEGDEASFRQWVFAAARQRLQEAHEEGGLHPVSHTAEAVHDVSDEHRAVNAALARIRALGPQQADVLLLRALGGLDVSGVAQITGDPPDVVHQVEMEALQRLQDGGPGNAEILRPDRATSEVQR